VLLLNFFVVVATFDSFWYKEACHREYRPHSEEKRDNFKNSQRELCSISIGEWGHDFYSIERR
jgi:hypothetical protein